MDQVGQVEKEMRVLNGLFDCGVGLSTRVQGSVQGTWAEVWWSGDSLYSSTSHGTHPLWQICLYFSSVGVLDVRQKQRQLLLRLRLFPIEVACRKTSSTPSRSR